MLVAGGRIELPTRGFSTQLNIMTVSAVSLKIVTSFSESLSNLFKKSNLYVEP